jgi:hypothetical protein
MPFALIPTALGVCFCLVWAFIGGMILRDGHLAAEQERATEVGVLPMPSQRTVTRLPKAIGRTNQAGRSRAIRAAS